VTKFHCYIEHHEAVYDSDVEAATPEEAAVEAAQEHGIGGHWTVIPGEPVDVNVVKRPVFEAAPAGPEEGT